MNNARWLPGCVLACAVLAFGESAPAQTITQTCLLREGWTAIHVELEPTDPAIGVVFTNLPVESVWTYTEKPTTAEFIRDQNELPWSNPGWRRYLPPPDERSRLTTLFAVNANRVYLVRSTSAATLILTGRPVVAASPWAPDRFNLRGFAIDPENPPTYAEFFASSAAQAGQAGYRLDTDGQWVLLQPEDLLRSGEGYWVYCRGASDFVAPLALAAEGGGELDFAQTLDELALTLTSRHRDPVAVVIEDLAGPSPFAYAVSDPGAGTRWDDLPASQVAVLQPFKSSTWRLAVRRQAMAATTIGTVLSVRDGRGTRHRVGVRAARVSSPPGQPLASLRGPQPADSDPSDAPQDHVGLWVGTATLNGVSEPHGIDPADRVSPTPSQSEFNLRLLVHVDASGQARFLKEVIQLWQDGAYRTITEPNPDNPLQVVGLQVVDTNHLGHYVLLTDDRLISGFSGAGLRDGRPVGRRLSTVGFDFPGTHLDMDGAFSLGQQVTVTVTLEPGFATNPFRHGIHPDHDNLDVDFRTARTEALRVERAIELRFDERCPDDLVVHNFGYNVLTGDYRETLRGVHKLPLFVSGRFRLDRVTVTGELNPQPQ